MFTQSGFHFRPVRRNRGNGDRLQGHLSALMHPFFMPRRRCPKDSTADRMRPPKARMAGKDAEMAKKTSIDVTINDSTTFGELRAMFQEKRIMGKRPTAKALRENGELDVVAYDDAGSGEIKVYSNGYVFYSGVAGKVVMSLDECRSYSYADEQMDRHDPSLGIPDNVSYRKDMLSKVKWTVPIALRGSLRTIGNNSNKKGDRNRAEPRVEIGEDEPVDIWETIGDDRNQEPDARLIEEESLNELIAPLTEKQKEVALLLSQGLTQEEIGKVLGIKQRTVSHHIESIRKTFKKYFSGSTAKKQFPTPCR